jgi:hypothetical protein
MSLRVIDVQWRKPGLASCVQSSKGIPINRHDHLNFKQYTGSLCCYQQDGRIHFLGQHSLQTNKCLHVSEIEPQLFGCLARNVVVQPAAPEVVLRLQPNV